MSAALKLVNPDAEQVRRECIEGLTRACIQRRAWLKRELASEEARLTVFRRRLADQRGAKFIRVEAVEREFGGPQ